MRIITVKKKEEEKFLRKKTTSFDFSKFNAGEMRALLFDMKATMREANGVGLSANQVGHAFRMFVAEVPSENGKKFYALFNPHIEKKSAETRIEEEGCLSIPGVYGQVERSYQVTIVADDKSGKKIKIKTWGLLARIFQHEVDHLDGILFIDRAKNTRVISKNEN
ncbi:MAG: peptide deformylase [Patescibacteria group bacterium]